MDRQNQAEKYLKYWKNKLNLNEWELSVKLTDFNRTDYEQTGDINVDIKNKSAVILISKKDTGKDLNEVVLHELVHLMLWDLDHYAEEKIEDKKEYFTLLEKTVNQITKNILNASK